MGTDQYRIVWTKAAQRELCKIVAEILEAAPSRAIPFGRTLEKAVETLSWSPRRCPAVREYPGYRQLIVKKYRIVFHIAHREVIINTIVYPYQLFDPEGLK